MKNNQWRFFFLVPFAFFLFSTTVIAAEYSSGVTGKTTVGITFDGGTGELKEEKDSEKEKQTDNLPKTAEVQRNNYLFWGLFFLLVAGIKMRRTLNEKI